MKHVVALLRLISIIYLLFLFVFAFRPFRPIPGVYYGEPDVRFDDGALCIKRGTAFEVEAGRRLVEILKKSGVMTLAVTLEPGSAVYSHSSSIITLSQHEGRRNFTLEQAGNDLIFRLNTTGIRYDEIVNYFRVPHVFRDSEKIHVTVTYDGSDVRLFVNGVLQPQRKERPGDFNGWNRECVLLLGDEVKGGWSWHGKLYRFDIYDRVLASDSVRDLASGMDVSGAVTAYDFSEGRLRGGIRPLRYRNLFVRSDRMHFSIFDCVTNVLGFIPLAWLVYIWMPAGIRGQKCMARMLIPLVFGVGGSVLIEFIQQYVNSRVPSLPDLIYNISGTLIGTVVLWIALDFKNRFKMKENVS